MDESIGAFPGLFDRLLQLIAQSLDRAFGPFPKWIESQCERTDAFLGSLHHHFSRLGLDDEGS
jgi:hypothetical protein